MSADGERGGLPLSRHWLSYPGCWQPLPIMYWLMFGMLFLFLTTSLACFSTDFAFRITDLTSCHGPHNYMLYIRGVWGLANDYPCGVWGRGWTTCLLHDIPLLGPHFIMRYFFPIYLYRVKHSATDCSPIKCTKYIKSIFRRNSPKMRNIIASAYEQYMTIHIKYKL